MKPFALLTLPLMCAACVAEPPPRPMDEVPRQTLMANGDRAYHFANGCEIVVEPIRAVVKAEGDLCALHHRDIALLYAAGD